MDRTPTPLIKMDPAPARSEIGSLDRLRPGSPCPICKEGKLDYNGLLELECDRCGTVIGGGAGCT